MNKMAEAFNTTIEDLELELMKLVADQPVRIDSHNKVHTFPPIYFIVLFRLELFSPVKL